ncbi:protein NinG [Klebsiella pneumoniae subsp. ozaenae]|uniref:Protein NinG n=1 Tax=Klebsiella pneumoniae subsp. ozaenae TaxID=574 RepID=A0A378ABS1_KLEPO|nr:protein NinG [Klebsiella pneumoniae subsp. ozaenae]
MAASGDCGHFKTVGAYPELRFEERNAHKQCKSCNAGAGKYTAKEATVAQQYEAGLIARYGQEYVDWLNGPHEMNQLTAGKTLFVSAMSTAPSSKH